MKTLKSLLKQPISLLILFCLLTLALPLLVPMVPVHAQIAPNTTGTFDNLPASIAASSSSNVISTAVSVRQGRGMAILPLYKGGNVGAGDIILSFDLSADGTTWTTTKPLATTNALNGTNVVRHYHLFTADVLNNVRSIRLQTVENTATNTVTLTNVTWSVGN